MGYSCFGSPSKRVGQGITKRLSRIRNAWHFWFGLALVFTAQWFRFGGRRCSPLNAALYASVSRRNRTYVTL